MEREIKFRAWDGKLMWHEAFHMSAVGIAWKWNDSNYDVSEVIKWPVMQFTGLKDKHGVDIYEGDVVSGGPYHSKIKKTSIIVYRGNSFVVKDESFGWEGEDMWDWDAIEVIGNIYQKPQPLTAAQG